MTIVIINDHIQPPGFLSEFLAKGVKVRCNEGGGQVV